jgi:hypothetical protein
MNEDHMTEVARVIVPDRVEPRERTLSTAPDPNATPMQLLSIMTQRGVSMADLKDLVAMAKDWEANEARKQFAIAFAAFKAEAVSVIRNKKVTDGPLKGKSYAELFAVVDEVAPKLSKHGLSHSWKVTKDEKDWIEVTCFITHIAGHSESVSFGGPPDTGGAKNAIQARASTKTYLEKYTLLSILGLSSKDQDTDGNTITVTVEPEPEGFSKWADGLEDAAKKGSKAFEQVWAEATPKFRRHVIKFAEPWFKDIKAAASKVQVPA